jgi:hypothetical protein
MSPHRERHADMPPPDYETLMQELKGLKKEGLALLDALQVMMKRHGLTVWPRPPKSNGPRFCLLPSFITYLYWKTLH